MIDKWIKSQMNKIQQEAINKQVDFIEEQSRPAIVRMQLKSFLFQLGIKSAAPVKLGGLFRGQLRNKNSNGSGTSGSHI